jgi:hypothetical protein
VGIVRGQAIPLNSRDNLSYFLRLGPSPTVDSANVVQYLKVVLPLMGTDGDAGAIVTEETAIPDSVRAQLGERNLLPEVHPGIVGSLVVTLYAMSPNNLRRLEVRVFPRAAGSVIVDADLSVWDARPHN